MRPRMAWRAVLLPAPLGPIRPRIRPSSTRRSMPSTATVVPKALRRPRASMTDMASALLLGNISGGSGSGQQLFGRQSQPLDGGVNLRPLVGQESLTLPFQQQIVRTWFDEHAPTSLRLDEPLVDQLLVALENGDRIHAVLGCDIA